MKKITLLFVIISFPLAVCAQGNFDSFENEKDVTSVVVTKNMFKLLSKMDLDSQDPEVKDYLEMVDNLETIKIFTILQRRCLQKLRVMLPQIKSCLS